MHFQFPLVAHHDSLQQARQEFQNRWSESCTRLAAGLSIHEVDSTVTIAIDVPGMTEDDLQIDIHDGHLIVTGERKSTLPENGEAIFVNRADGPFERRVRIDDSFDPDSVDAVLSNGVLSVSLTRRAELQPRKVTIRAAN